MENLTSAPVERSFTGSRRLVLVMGDGSQPQGSPRSLFWIAESFKGGGRGRDFHPHLCPTAVPLKRLQLEVELQREVEECEASTVQSDEKCVYRQGSRLGF